MFEIDGRTLSYKNLIEYYVRKLAEDYKEPNHMVMGKSVKKDEESKLPITTRGLTIKIEVDKDD